jgi:rhamnogalacturonan hydrolase
MRYDPKFVSDHLYSEISCLKLFKITDSDRLQSYTTTIVATSAPSHYTASTMAYDLPTAVALNTSITIPTIPASFDPGVAPISSIAGHNSSRTTISSMTSVTKAQTRDSSGTSSSTPFRGVALFSTASVLSSSAEGLSAAATSRPLLTISTSSEESGQCSFHAEAHVGSHAHRHPHHRPH